jgi:hypothetical protein
MYMPTSKMYMPRSKTALIALALLLGGCGSQDENAALREAEAQTDEQAALDGKVECALSGSATFERTCTTEQIAGPDGMLLVIRHADGGFRRFNILTDGRGLEPADGFDETRISIMSDGMIEVSSGDDRYRLPAQVKGKGASNAG